MPKPILLEVLPFGDLRVYRGSCEVLLAIWLKNTLATSELPRGPFCSYRSEDTLAHPYSESRAVLFFSSQRGGTLSQTSTESSLLFPLVRKILHRLELNILWLP